MTKREMARSAAFQHELTINQSLDVIDSFVRSIKAEVAAGRRVELRGFGVFYPSQRKARKGRNPKTGEEVDVPAKTAVRFKPSSLWTKEVNR